MNKKAIALLLVLTLLLSLGASAFAAQDSRAVIGADLTEEQIKTVY